MDRLSHLATSAPPLFGLGGSSLGRFLVVCPFSVGMPSCTAIFCTRRLDHPESLATLLRYYPRARYRVPKVLFVFDRSTVVHHEGSSGMTIFRLGYHRHTPS